MSIQACSLVAYLGYQTPQPPAGKVYLLWVRFVKEGLGKGHACINDITHHFMADLQMSYYNGVDMGVVIGVKVGIG